MLVKDVMSAIEAFAPLAYQESYDNCGLQVGDPMATVTGMLLTLDVTEDLLAEAIEKNCNLIIAHHPLIFSGLKKITGRNYVERIVASAIKNDIHIYAAHTNLDNVRQGVNAKIAEKLGLQNTSILAPKGTTLYKLYTYVPEADLGTVRDALFAAGAGSIGNYSECSFNTEGIGTFRGNEHSNPAIGEAGGDREYVAEVKLEVLVPVDLKNTVIRALRASHPYEEVAYELIALENYNQEIGAGMVGFLPEAMEESAFLSFLQRQMKVDCIRHTQFKGKPVHKVALCGGSGSFLLKDAISTQADVFITGDFKYHQFFDAEGKIIIADIGHYESEQFTVEIFKELLTKKFPNFAVVLANIYTNPVKYFF